MSCFGQTNFCSKGYRKCEPKMALLNKPRHFTIIYFYRYLFHKSYFDVDNMTSLSLPFSAIFAFLV